MKIVRAIAELGLEGEVGLVPTMGGLHAGHLALIRAAREENEVVVASLFVNPAQFGDPDDLAAYPRGERRDSQLAAEAGVDVLFAPSVEDMYPPGFGTWVDVEGTGGEGAARPGHSADHRNLERAPRRPADRGLPAGPERLGRVLRRRPRHSRVAATA